MALIFCNFWNEMHTASIFAFIILILKDLGYAVRLFVFFGCIKECHCDNRVE